MRRSTLLTQVLAVNALLVGVTALTGILFGIAPALRATRLDISSALKETGRSVIASRSWLGTAPRSDGNPQVTTTDTRCTRS